MTDFELAGFDSLYEYLERHATDFKYVKEMSDYFQKLRDKLAQLNDTGGVERAQWEVDAFNFMTKDGQLNWQFQGTDKDGDPFEYPTFDRFDDKAYAYFARRQSETNNPALKARYSHLMWQGPKKTQQYAQAAVEAYLLLIPVYERKDLENPDDHFGHNVVDAARNALLLSIGSRLDASRSTAEVYRLIKEFPIESHSWYSLRYDLLNLMLGYRKHLDSSELRSIPILCDETAQTLATKGNLHRAITMWELGQTADLKLQTVTCDWSRKIAEGYETLMLRREKDPMSAGHFCEQALVYYRKAKDDQKVRELEKKREQFAKTIQLQSVDTQIDLTEHIKWCRQISAEIAEKPVDQIITTLAVDQGLLPDIDDVKRLAKESLQNHPVMGRVPETRLDDRRHVAQHVAAPDEKERAEILELFGFFLRMDKLHLVNGVIFAAFNAGKLTKQSVTKFLREHSWLGRRLRLEIAAGDIREYTWMDLLEPGLEAYFEALRAYTEGKEPPHALVLAIDSLTVKFEGLLRDLCRFQGVTTTFDKPESRDKPDRIVTHEKYITQLLREPMLKNLLSSADLLFLKYLLVEHIGVNLRHKVAHCLLSFEDYDLGKAHLVFLGILRLSKFNVQGVGESGKPAFQ